MKIGIIGLGLIGGSIAKAARKVYPDCRIVALNRSQDSLDAAKKEGTVNEGVHKVTDAFKGCDFIFLCAPVNTNISFLEKLKPFLGEDTILTDVGSVKTEIHENVSKLLPGANFIGGHPMAGKEKVRFDNSSEKLLEGAYYYLTPSEGVDEKYIIKLEELIKKFGSKPVTVDPHTHDFIVAGISHVPHMAAYTLVKLVKDEDTPEEHMRFSAAGGFKDITRVASSDPTMWQQICLSNKDNIVELMDRYIDELKSLKELISSERSEELYRLFDESKKYRDSIIG